MTQIKITLPENVMENLRSEAKRSGLSPNILARARLCDLYWGVEKGRNSCLLRVENWNEIEAYVKVKHPGLTVGDFASKVTVSEMKRCPLQKGQKEEYARLLGQEA